jgi:hypothetical protein
VSFASAALIGAGVLLVVLAVYFVFWPFRLALELQALGDPGGDWLVAGGAELGPFALTGAAARGVAPRVQVHVFGRRLLTRELRADPERRPERRPEPRRARRFLLDRLSDLDPIETARFLVGERRRFRVEDAELSLDFSFRDVALTGKCLGACYALDGLFSPSLRVLATPSWESEDRASGKLRGTVALWPWLALFDLMLFVLRYARRRRAGSAPNLDRESRAPETSP